MGRHYRKSIEVGLFRINLPRRGWTVIHALVGLHLDAGVHSRPGGKAAWGPPAHAALRI
ncbi:hypothetical protein GCM10022224_090910 [Nonomuraea antimicrobica]|uniref:Uncharacterized protein n=1 Tax=Nonomuraea antimicrobica TaxID=561173 RepID=A0ABP7DX38_9ACTN